MKKIAVIAGMGLLSLSAAYAQQDSTLNRTVVVENQYNPTVMDASKINVLPKVEEPVVPKRNIDYATSLRPVGAWKNESMPAIVRDWTSEAAYRGYLRAGYGNNGNVDAGLGYLWDISKKDRMNVGASFNGWNGDLFHPDSEYGWDSRFYKTDINLDYVHRFAKVDLNLGGSFASQVFNYMGYSEISLNGASSGPNDRQHHTFADGHLGFASTDQEMPVQFQAEVGLKYFKEKYPMGSNDAEANKETNAYFLGDVWKQNPNDSRLGLKVRFDSYAYASDRTEDWTSLDFNPYFSSSGDAWKLRLGAHIDWLGKGEGEVYFSPDVNVEYNFADSYVLFAKAGGGRETSGYYELAQMAPYVYESNFLPTYLKLDAALGLKASPADGWWFLVSGGYQMRENDVCWSLGGAGNTFWYSRNYYGDTKVFYGTAELKYDYKDLLDFALKGTYYHWDWTNTGWSGGDPGESALSLKPELELNAEVGAKVMEGLRVHAGYEYVKRCNDNGGDPVSNLYLGADYALLKNLSVFGKVKNLLDKEYYRPDGYPAQGLNFLAGISLRF